MKVLIFILLTAVSLSAQEFICEGETKTCTINPSMGSSPFTYQWTSPSSVVTTSASVVIDEAGVWLWETTDAIGCKRSGTKEVEIIPEPSFSINAGDRCSNKAQVINATGVPSGFTFYWTFGLGSIPSFSTSSNVSVVWTTGGTKTITLVISKNGCDYTNDIDIDISAISGNVICE